VLSDQEYDSQNLTDYQRGKKDTLEHVNKQVEALTSWGYSQGKEFGDRLYTMVIRLGLK
jgi:hypothetical protein